MATKFIKQAAERTLRRLSLYLNLAFLFSAVLAAQALASVIPVSPSESIEAAIVAAAPGDTILLEDGIYTESVFVNHRRVTIASQFLFDGDSAHIASTILQRDDAHPDTQSCFIIVDCPDSVRIVGLTLRNGLGTFWLEEDLYAGGCVYSRRARVSLEHCVVRSGTAAVGGGIYCFRRENETVNSLRLLNCLVTTCASDFWGGGLYANRCSLEVRACTFRNCSSQSDGGISVLAPSALIEDCVFDSCSGIVGGLTLGDGSSVVRRCTFTNNSATLTFFAAHLVGGQGRHRIEGNYFGPTLSNTPGIRFCCDTGDTTIFVGNVMEFNEATVRPGNLLLAGVPGEISYNIIRYNQGNNGYQIYCFQGTTVDIHHNVFQGNVSINPLYPSVLLTGPNARQRFHDNIVIGNSGKTIDYLSSYPTTIDARNNWWGHESGPYHPTQNPFGQGDTILSDSVLFEPWLLSPPDTSTSVTPSRPETPINWKLMNVYPNPFNSELSISLAGIMGNEFTLKLFDLLGREVAVLQEGRGHGGTMNYVAPHSLASGVYFLQAAEGAFSEIRKVVFLK